MMRRVFNRMSTELKLLIFAVAAIFAIGTLAVIFLPEPTQQTNSVTNSRDGGVSIIRQWLERSGFQVERITRDPIDPTPYAAILIFNPPGRHSDDEITAIANWVNSGGRLIVASTETRVNPLLDAFQTRITQNTVVLSRMSLTAPTLDAPAFDNVQTRFANIVETDNPNAVIHMANGQDAVLLSIPVGAGEVFVGGTVYPFTNRGIQDPASQRLVANLMAGIDPQRARVGFDEAQLPTAGDSDAPLGVMGWMVRSAAGRGVLLLGVLALVYLISRGRRLGAPVPLLEDRLRREPVEYIVALANLFRRSGRQTDILSHYRTRLRRRLSERYSIDASLSDAQFASVAASRSPDIDEAALSGLLMRLQNPRVTESDLLTLATEVNAWLVRVGTR
jgi:hypothetical protein